MPSQRNTKLLQVVKDKVNKANAVFFVNYQGITHKQLEEARNVLRDLKAEIAILKNNLTNIALKEKNVDAKEKLQGPLAAFFSYDDPIKTANALFQFLKKSFDPERIKFGVFSTQGGSAVGGEWQIIDSKMVVTLASLPSREILLGKLVGLLQSPIRSLVYDLNWTTSQFVRTLKAVEDKKAATN